ncbi:MAG: cysteine hydrolase [Pseudomonadales bacterium]|nr:cysteine hydrolase [Pseudomonadales bacterium]
MIKSSLSRKPLTNTKWLLDIARECDIKVIQSPFILDKTEKEKYREIPFPPKLFDQFTAGTWRAEYTEGIFDPSDLVVTGRTGFDNTKGSNLRELLTRNGIRKIYFIGFTTDHCVAETMETLSAEGYECIFISDCTAARNKKLQEKIESKYKNIVSKQAVSEIRENR